MKKTKHLPQRFLSPSGTFGALLQNKKKGGDETRQAPDKLQRIKLALFSLCGVICNLRQIINVFKIQNICHVFS